MALPLFDDPDVGASVRELRTGIVWNSPEYREYVIWFRNGIRDDAEPNDVPGDPAMTYARRLGYRHGRLFRPLPCMRERRQ